MGLVGSELRLTRLDAADLRQWRRALEVGQPVRLALEDVPPPGVRLDELAPLADVLECRRPDVQAAAAAFVAPGAAAGDARVTVLVPSHRQVPLGLASLLGQDLEVRVVVLSNGEDGPRQVPGAEVWRVPWLGHGPTRQAAAERVEDPYVLVLTDDAIPRGAGFVRTLVEALEAGSWDAVIARQVPWPDADPVTRRRVRRWTPPGHAVIDAPQADHVCTLYRTETLRQWPLPAVPIAEDLAWSQGRRVGYVPSAPVLHSHTRRAAELFRRERAMHRQRRGLGMEPTVRGVSGLVGALPGAIGAGLRFGPAEAGRHLAEILGEWIGGR